MLGNSATGEGRVGGDVSNTILLPLAACLLLTGCGYTGQTTLSYTPLTPRTGFSKNLEVTVARFGDLRSDPRVGILVNLFDEVEGGYLPDRDVGAWVAEAVAAELRSCGFRTRLVDSPGRIIDGRGLVVTGDVLSLHTYQPGGLMLYSRASLAVRIYHDGRLRYEKAFVGKFDWATQSWAASEQDVSRGCCNALREAMVSMAPALDRQLQYAGGAALSDAAVQPGPPECRTSYVITPP